MALLLLARPVSSHERVTATCRAGDNATVEIELRNASDKALSVFVLATLWLTPVDGGPRARLDGTLITAVDPTTGSSEGLFETRAGRLTLPSRGSHSVRVDLESLMWSLSPNDVESPRALWQVAAPGEYDLMVRISAIHDRTNTDILETHPVRIRVLRE
jgi:hypothetical protein